MSIERKIVQLPVFVEREEAERAAAEFWDHEMAELPALPGHEEETEQLKLLLKPMALHFFICGAGWMLKTVITRLRDVVFGAMMAGPPTPAGRPN